MSDNLPPLPISLEKFTELAHRTASRYSHRSELEKIAYTFLPHTLEDFHRQVCAAVEANTPAVLDGVSSTGKMTHQRAKFFMLRFMAEEKLLGPNEQAALAHVINLLEREQYAALQPQPVAQPVQACGLDYKHMFLEAVQALADIDKLIGLPEDGCNDPQVTVSALADFLAGAREAAQFRDHWVDAQYQSDPQLVQAQQFNLQRTPISGWGQQPIGMSTSQSTNDQALTSADVASRVCRAVAELPDRNSPDDWPEAMLVTQSELHETILDAIAEWVDCSGTAQPKPATDSVVQTAVIRALDEANVRNDVLRGMCIEVALEKARDMLEGLK